MQTEVNFSKIKKCDQSWDEMAACDGGRLCTTCNNVVQDFRGKTSWEVAVIHAHNETKVCGVYDKHHLENPNRKVVSDSNRKKLLLASALGVMTTSSISANLLKPIEGMQVTTFKSQVIKHNHQGHEGIEALNNSHKSIQMDSVKVVRGVVKEDYDNYEPLSGCNIIILGTSEGTISDIDGSFMLNVTDAFEDKDSIILDIAYVGYAKQRKVVYKGDLNAKNEMHVDILLKADLEMEAFNVLPKQPFHKKVWSGIKNIFVKEN